MDLVFSFMLKDVFNNYSLYTKLNTLKLYYDKLWSFHIFKSFGKPTLYLYPQIKEPSQEQNMSSCYLIYIYIYISE